MLIAKVVRLRAAMDGYLSTIFNHSWFNLPDRAVGGSFAGAAVCSGAVEQQGVV